MLELNQIYLMDCREGFKLIPDNSIDLIVTDPPYRLTSRGNAGSSGGMCQKSDFKKGKVFKHNDIDISEYAPEFYRVLKDGSHCYIMTNHINLQHMLNVCTEAGLHFIKSLIWDKGNKIMSQFYMSQFEYILFFRKGNAVRINNCSTSDILNVPNRKTKVNGKNLHDTEKPVKLMRILIENSSKQNGVVLDPFMGIGTTAIACINSHRNFLGFEIDKDYWKIATERVEAVKAQTTLWEVGG